MASVRVVAAAAVLQLADGREQYFYGGAEIAVELLSPASVDFAVANSLVEVVEPVEVLPEPEPEPEPVKPAPKRQARKQ